MMPKPPKNIKEKPTSAQALDTHFFEPRRKDSTTWTALPESYLSLLQGAVDNVFDDLLPENLEIIVEGRIYNQEILIRLGHLPSQSIRQMNFELSMDYDAGKDKVVDILDIAVDCIGGMFQEFLAKSNVDWPIDWIEEEFHSKKVFLRTSRINSVLEKQADQLLGLATDGLISDNKSGEEE